MIRLCTERRMKAPEFKEHGNFFQVVFHKSAKRLGKRLGGRLGGINGGINEGLSKGLSEGLKSLCHVVRDNPGIKAKDIPPLLGGRPLKTIEKQVISLMAKGLIERRKGRKAGGYFAIGGLNDGMNGGIKDKFTKISDQGLFEGLNEGLKSLYLVVRDNPGIKAKDTPLLLGGRHLKTIEGQIKELIEKKLIERRGSRKTGGYFAM